MARPRKSPTAAALDTLMERWAQWVHQGGVIPRSASVMEIMIANKGVMCFGSGGKKGPNVDCVEARIEAALMGLALDRPNAVTAVRLHYGAIRLPGMAIDADQATIAHAMGVSLRAYRRYLSQGREHVRQRLAI